MSNYTLDGPVLIARLRGGLGNQLFQYAAARSLACRNQVPLFIDPFSGFQGDPFGRQYELEQLSISAPKVPRGGTKQPSASARIVREYFRIREYIAMNYLGKTYDPAIHSLRVRRSIVFDAYCHSYRYFSETQSDIRSEFAFRSMPDGIDRNLASEVSRVNSVCLHLRRQYGRLADGSSSAAIAKHYGACDLEYYRRSLLELRSIQGPMKVYVFSDDINWARENCEAFAVEGGDVEVIDDADTMRCFYLMTLCRHFVIANSTFSWWAAWLGKHPEKLVYAPPIWSNGQRRFPRDLIPTTWKIPALPR